MTRKAVLIAFFVGISTVPAARADFTATAALLGINETPPNASPAFGFATVSYESGLNDILYSVTFNNLSATATASHIHFGLPTVAGPVILPFLNPGPPSANSGSFSGVLHPGDLIPNPGVGINTWADAVNAIALGQTYVNIHDAEFPGGEIRGQLIVPEPSGLALFALGTVGLIATARFRRRAAGA